MKRCIILVYCTCQIHTSRISLIVNLHQNICIIFTSTCNSSYCYDDVQLKQSVSSKEILDIQQQKINKYHNKNVLKTGVEHFDLILFSTLDCIYKSILL